jgi:hypothetical protein
MFYPHAHIQASVRWKIRSHTQTPVDHTTIMRFPSWTRTGQRTPVDPDVFSFLHSLTTGADIGFSLANKAKVPHLYLIIWNGAFERFSTESEEKTEKKKKKKTAKDSAAHGFQSERL